MNLNHAQGRYVEQHHHITISVDNPDKFFDYFSSDSAKQSLKQFTHGWAEIAQRAIVLRAPKKTGILRSGICVNQTPERSKTNGKIVWDVWFDSSMTDDFVRFTKSGKRYYYPASQEYGFRMANRTSLPGQSERRVPGKYFMREGLIDVAPVLIAEANAYIDEVMRNG